MPRGREQKLGEVGEWANMKVFHTIRMRIDSCRVAVYKGMSCVILDFDRMVLELPQMPVLSVGFFVGYGQL